MDLCFYNFLDVSRHEKDIKQNFGSLRFDCKYSFPGNMTRDGNYFNKAENFFLEDMDKVSEEIYANILTRKELEKIKFKPLQLGECIVKGLNHFITIYRDEVLYNVGGVGFSNIENEVGKLIDNLKREAKDRSDTYHRKYKKEVKKIHVKRWKVFGSILGFIGFPTFVYLLSFGYAWMSHKISSQDGKAHMIISRAK